MTLTDFLDNISWADLKHDGSEHYHLDGVEKVDLYRSLGILPEWALVGAIDRVTRNIKAIKSGKDINPADIKKVIHELLFLYVELKDRQ